MATVTPVNLVHETLTAAPFAATNSGGDNVAVSNPNIGHVIEFNNGAAGAVTVNIANQVAASLVSKDYGKVEKADLSVSIAAGATRCLYIPANKLAMYLNGSSQIAITYTSHDALLLVRAISLQA